MTRKMEALVASAWLFLGCTSEARTELERGQSPDPAQEQERLKIAAESAEVREEQRKRDEAASDLGQLVAEACEGIAAADLDRCPVEARYVDGQTDLKNGVEVKLKAAAGSAEEIKRRVHCYRARLHQKDAQETKPNIQVSCAFDFARLGDVETRVEQRDGAVYVSLTSAEEDVNQRLRDSLAQRQPLNTRSR